MAARRSTPRPTLPFRRSSRDLPPFRTRSSRTPARSRTRPLAARAGVRLSLSRLRTDELLLRAGGSRSVCNTRAHKRSRDPKWKRHQTARYADSVRFASIFTQRNGGGGGGGRTITVAPPCGRRTITRESSEMGIGAPRQLPAATKENGRGQSDQSADRSSSLVQWPIGEDPLDSGL